MIRIDKRNEMYRAVVNVRCDINVINGKSTPDGPWVEGYGDTPDQALADMYANVGRAYVASLEVE